MLLITYVTLTNSYFELRHSIRRKDCLLQLTPTDELNTCNLLMTNGVFPELAINISWLTLFFFINGILRSISVSEMCMAGAFKESFPSYARSREEEWPKPVFHYLRSPYHRRNGKGRQKSVSIRNLLAGLHPASV